MTKVTSVKSNTGQSPKGTGESKILVVEDDPLNMELVSDLLAVHGYTVLQAATGQAALALAAQEQPNLILMDIGLPGMDGLTACRALKADPATAAIPVVVLTSYAMRGDEEKILAAGCNGYITKPIDTRQFCQLVDGFLK